MTKPGRKLGRPRGPRFLKYQITLDEESGEWGKAQPEGLSALVRNLLKSERSRRESTQTGRAENSPEVPALNRHR